MLETRAGGGSQLFQWANQIVRRRRSGRSRATSGCRNMPTRGCAPPRSGRGRAARPIRPSTRSAPYGGCPTRRDLTVDDPAFASCWAMNRPRRSAARLAAGTRPAIPRFAASCGRGLAAVQASDDPMIRFALRIQPILRGALLRNMRIVSSADRPRQQALARARFAAYGTSLYPGATGTLRLTYGRIEGWTDEGRTVEPATTFAGLWARNRRRAVRPRAPFSRGARPDPGRHPPRRHRFDRHDRRLVRLAGGQCGRRDHRRQFRFHRAHSAQRLWLRPGGQSQHPGHRRRNYRRAAPRLWHGPSAPRARRGTRTEPSLTH